MTKQTLFMILGVAAFGVALLVWTIGSNPFYADAPPAQEQTRTR